VKSQAPSSSFLPEASASQLFYHDWKFLSNRWMTACALKNKKNGG